MKMEGMIVLLTCCWKEQNILEEFLHKSCSACITVRTELWKAAHTDSIDNHHPSPAGFGAGEGKEKFLEGALFPEFESPFSLATWWLISMGSVDAAVTMGRLPVVTQDVFAPPPFCVQYKCLTQHCNFYTLEEAASTPVTLWGLGTLVLKAELLQPFSRIQGLN